MSTLKPKHSGWPPPVAQCHKPVLPGLTLGGGIGHLMGVHGLTSDNLHSVDLVTATGDYLSASVNENGDLFWAMRGAGANFGIATSFEFNLHPVGPTIFGGMALFPPERFGEVLNLFRDLCRSAPDELPLVCGLISGPAGEPLVALPLGWFGPIHEGEAQVAPIRALGPLVADYGPLPYGALQSMFDAAVPAGIPRYWKSGILTALDDSVIATIVEHSVKRPTALSAVLLFHLHGAVTRHASDETAFGARLLGWDLEILAQWADPAQEPILWPGHEPSGRRYNPVPQACTSTTWSAMTAWPGFAAATRGTGTDSSHSSDNTIPTTSSE